MSSLVGVNGHKISSDAKQIKYEVGGIRIETADTPESMIQKALTGAQQLVANQVYQDSFKRSGSAMVAQADAQSAALKLVNPFQLEPGALAIFMLMSREIEHRDRVIEALAERLDALDGRSSKELLEKSWHKKPESKNQDEEGSK